MTKSPELLPHEILKRDFDSVVPNGLQSKLQNRNGKTALGVTLSFLKTAFENASEEEKKYLPIV
jgi:hypothetical protein